MREIVFDTETTGLDPAQGHRLVEVGCIELVNRIPSGNTFHRYFNPERDVPPDAVKIHGLNTEFLKDKPLFASIADQLLDFLGDAPIVAHNATFDLGFLNAELERSARAPLKVERMVDTLLLARRKHPGSSNRLDDLCARYRIDASRRVKHGALLDAELLAEVYVELIGERQAILGLTDNLGGLADGRIAVIAAAVRPTPLLPRLSAADLALHRDFVATLGGQAVWQDYLQASPQISAAG
jgi:DNA polymerase III subunit epsilon